MTARLSEANYDVMLALASLPEQIRGFGHVKRASYGAAMVMRDSYLAALHAGRRVSGDAKTAAAESEEVEETS